MRPLGCSSSAPNEPASRLAKYNKREAHTTDGRLEKLPELEQQQHVHADVEDAEVQEARRDQSVVLAMSLQVGLVESEDPITVAARPKLVRSIGVDRPQVDRRR